MQFSGDQSRGKLLLIRRSPANPGKRMNVEISALPINNVYVTCWSTPHKVIDDARLECEISCIHRGIPTGKRRRSLIYYLPCLVCDPSTLGALSTSSKIRY